MFDTYSVNAKEVENKYVRFVSGSDKGRVAKVCGMNLGRPGRDDHKDVVIEVVIFLDGFNSWNHVHSHVQEGDRVEIVSEPITLPILEGLVPTESRTYDAVCRPQPLSAE